jgi:hypothetical protein
MPAPFPTPFLIDPHALYCDGVLVLELGLASESLIRARREGKLRYRRIGGRAYYTGEQLLAWLHSTPTRGEVADGE